MADLSKGKSQARLLGTQFPFPFALKDSPEFSAHQLAPLGVPGNPLDGTPNAQDLSAAVSPKRMGDGTVNPLVPPNRMEQAGMTDVGGVAGGKQMAQAPEQLLTPDTVSATDPAYSIHPVIQAALTGLARIPSASPIGDSPWTQYKGKSPYPLTGSQLRQSLSMGTKGLDLPYVDQGMSTTR